MVSSRLPKKSPPTSPARRQAGYTFRAFLSRPHGFKRSALFFIFLLGLTPVAAAREVRTPAEALRLADAAFLNDQYDKAGEYYHRAMELAPKQAVPVIRLGQLLYAESRYTEAAAAFDQADLLKKDRVTQKFLNTAIKKIDEERSLLQRIEDAARSNDTGELSRLHEEAAERFGRPPALMALMAPHLEYLLKIDPKNRIILKSLAEGYFTSSDPARAFVYYKKLLKESRPQLVLFRCFGDTAVNVGAYDEARLSYKKAVREAVRTGRMDEVRDLKRTAHALPAFSARIDEYIRDADYAEAFRELRKCLARDPSHPWAVVQMGRIYEELGRLGQAQRLYQKAVQWRPEDPSAHYAMGRFYLYKKKKFYEALDEFLLFRALLSENLNLTVDAPLQKKLKEYLRDSTRSISYLYLEVLGDPASAVKELEALTRSGNAEAKDYYDLGVAYWRVQKRSAAYQCLRKAIQLDPRSEVAKDAKQLIASIQAMSKEGFEVQANRG